MDFSNKKCQQDLAKVIAPIFGYGTLSILDVKHVRQQRLKELIKEEQEFWSQFENFWIPCTIFLLNRAKLRANRLFWQSVGTKLDMVTVLELREKKVKAKNMMKNILEVVNMPDKKIVENMEKESAVIFLNYMHAGLRAGAKPFLEDFANLVEQVLKNSRVGILCHID